MAGSHDLVIAITNFLLPVDLITKPRSQVVTVLLTFYSVKNVFIFVKFQNCMLQ